MTLTQTPPVDSDRLDQFLGRFVNDLGATIAAGSVLIGDRLGLYRALAGGPSSRTSWRPRTGTAARYVTEWLRGQAAGGYVSYDPASEAYSLTPEQQAALTDDDGAVFLPGAFQLALGSLRALPRVVDAFRTGDGIGWHEHDDDLSRHRAVLPARLRRQPGRRLAAGARRRRAASCEAGAEVADVGCGHGASTVLMAQAFPNSTFVGFDYHEGSIELARERAADAGVADRVTFEVATATDFRGGTYDLVTIFDCLHDMGDPVGAARPRPRRSSPTTAPG